MHKDLLNELNNSLESFLLIWTENMREAGYLVHTTAKRDDCIESFKGVIESIRRFVPDDGVPTFAPMLKQGEKGARFMLESARKHRLRGVTAGMYLGCFKTLIHSLEDIVLTLDFPAEEKLKTLLTIRRVSDVLEVLFIDDWERSSVHELTEQLQQVNRDLTLKKSRYQNIFHSTSDLVLLTDEAGVINEVNPETEKYLPVEQLYGQPFWEFLNLESRSMEAILEKYPDNEGFEVTSRTGDLVFRLHIVPLYKVSLATQGYMLILNDITLLADYRRELERRVTERTAELTLSQDLLRKEKAQTDEMNVTLRNVMKSIETDRCDLEQNVSLKIRSHLLPALEKVRHESEARIRSSFLDLIQEQMIALTSGFNSELDASLLKLSRTEIRICGFIQAGCSSKEISEAMNLAFDTIRTHRKNIRKKLGLQGKDVNLHSYLANRNCTFNGPQ